MDLAARHQRFAELFVHHQRRVYGYILLAVANSHDADDLFAETSLVLWRRVADYDFDAEFIPWAFGVARNVIRSWRAKQGRDRHLFCDELVAQLAAEREEQSAWLDEVRGAMEVCLQSLVPAQRSLVQRCYGGTESLAAIAQSEGKSLDAVYQQLSRMRRRLLKCIQARLASEVR